MRIVGDNAEADPALDAGQAFVAAEVIVTFQKAGASFTASASLLGVEEPALLLRFLTIQDIASAPGAR